MRGTCLLISGLKVKNKERNVIIDCYQPGVLLCGYQFLMVS